MTEVIDFASMSQETIKYIALNDGNIKRRVEAVDNVISPNLLSEIALNANSFSVKYNAVDKLTDQSTLRQIALKNDEVLFIRFLVIEKLNDENTLNQIILNDVSEDIRQMAMNRLEELKNINTFNIHSIFGVYIF